MKKIEFVDDWDISCLKKTFRIMRLTLFLFLAVILQTFANEAYSQKTKLSLDYTNARLEVVLDDIENLSEFFFLANEKLVDLNRNVSFSVKNKRINEILDIIFAGTDVVYTITDRKIILAPSFLTEDIYVDVKQQHYVSGKVTDSNNQSLPGVTVLVKGTTQGTITDINGAYSLTNIPDDATLVFSFVGMRTQEVAIEGRTTFTVVMEEDVIGIEEVVAIGYGTRIKSELTGSVATITGETIENVSSGNIIKNLQGRVPGLIINDRGGDVGLDSHMEIFVRGKSTWGDNSPLVVIDGVPRSLDDMRFIAQDDIESISVLKDASAAIYGAAAANGVIVIVTKRGKKGVKPTIQFNSSFGLSYFSRVLDLMDSYQYAQYENEAYQRTGMSPLFSQKDLEMFKSGEDLYTHPNTDWFKESYQAMSPQNRQSLTLLGGTDDIQYYVGGEYFVQESHYGIGEFGSKRYNIRSNIDARVSRILKLGADVSFRLIDQLSPYSSGSIDNRVGRSLPIDAAYWPNGLPAYGGELGDNPALMGTKLGGYTDRSNFDFRSKFSFDLNLDFLTNGLSLDGYFAYDRANSKSKNLKLPFTVYQYAKGEFIESYGHGGSSYKPLNESRYDNSSKLSHIKVNYINSFENHYVNVFMAYEQVEGQYSNMGGSRKDIFTEQLPELNLGVEDGRSVSGVSGESGKVNYFGSLSYNYMGKYLFDFSLRRDGSFNFPPTKRFGTFPGMSIGWNVTEELFVPKTNIIDNLKLRASMAKMGNDKVAQFQYLSTYALSSYYIFGEGCVI